MGECKQHFAQLLVVCHGRSIWDAWKGVEVMSAEVGKSQLNTAFEEFGVNQWHNEKGRIREKVLL